MHLARRLLGLCIVVVAGCDGSAEPPTSPSNPSPRPGPVLGGPAGSYIVTLTASPSCDFVRNSVTGEMLPFPDAVKVRRYEGEFANGVGKLTAVDDPSNRVNIGGIDLYFNRGQPLMFVTGTELTIISPPCGSGDYWWEILHGLPGEENFFELCGTWRGSMENPAQIDGTIGGAFVFYQGYAFNKRVDQSCAASDHRFTMVQR